MNLILLALVAWLAYGFVFHAMTVLWVAFFKQPKKPATPGPPAAAPAASPPAVVAVATPGKA